ncbi:23S rRNA (pseudouridine(1915)-N(3))-methyltransferase RlmH [Phyllobacterium zundukense]|uniref:Ribosomal RNA large subunit methyltransferase H n=1 Tax=Phyllobacterium zundukense TaxID=1867719 RepID=A0A2N9VX56_9HYPH|nr:23S rRNA (pseudouridine(1915)-N(3))-methyltransferase RlmH [Phyllobacterium zundukense]ATU90334.1 23S rRNA (pseudouridine(1915)-N(3))-methyltransferase RlmH [Phyllobacterium zundukense]PIO44074.1 23S rRNA (pseudouridine(1915)-N(3))-methyltransferase RlmH [Phyllobacterium zundukense]
MRITVFAVGRMKSGPERELAGRYFDRLKKTGTPLGLEFSSVTEISESRAQQPELRKQEESSKVLEALDQGGVLVLLDERGKTMPSEAFAQAIARFRDAGKRQLLVAIGGPDGHDASLRDRADLVLALGAMTWPHQIVRILVAEQLYRTTTILSGHPYHRV